MLEIALDVINNIYHHIAMPLASCISRPNSPTPLLVPLSLPVDRLLLRTRQRMSSSTQWGTVMNTQNQITIDTDLFSVYDDLELRCNTHLKETTSGKPSIVIDDHWDFGRLALIDKFVRKVLTSNDAVYIETTGSTGRITWVPHQWIEPYRRAVTAMMSPEMHARFHVRNVFVDIFLHACKKQKILFRNG